MKAWKTFNWLGYDAVVGSEEQCNERSDSIRGKRFIHSFSDNLLLLLLVSVVVVVVNMRLFSHISTAKYIIIALATEFINLVTNEYGAITYAQKKPQGINWEKSAEVRPQNVTPRSEFSGTSSAK